MNRVIRNCNWRNNCWSERISRVLKGVITGYCCFVVSKASNAQDNSVLIAWIKLPELVFVRQSNEKTNNSRKYFQMGYKITFKFVSGAKHVSK